MAFADMFVPEGTVELKIVELRDMFRSDALNWAENRCMRNGLRAGVPAEHILAMLDEDNNDDNILYENDKEVNK